MKAAFAMKGQTFDSEEFLNPKGSAKEQFELSYNERNGVSTLQSVIAGLDFLQPLIWASLSLSDKNTFKEKYQSLWFHYLGSVVPKIAETILDLLKDQIEIKQMGDEEIDFDKVTQQFKITLKDGSKLVSKYLINATIAKQDIKQSVLLDNMNKQNLVTEHPLGGIYINFTNLKVTDSEGKIIPNLYSIGQNTGVEGFTTNIRIVAKKGQQVAEVLVNDLLEKLKKAYSHSAQYRMFTQPYGQTGQITKEKSEEGESSKSEYAP